MDGSESPRASLSAGTPEDRADLTEASAVLRFPPLSLGLVAPANVLAALAASVEPFFAIVPTAREEAAAHGHLATLRAWPMSLPSERRPAGTGETVSVDTSLYAHLCSSGERWETADAITVRIELGDTWVTINQDARLVEIWQPDPARLLIELERTIKGLITVGAELTGAIQCHSAAATSADDPEAGAVLLLGDMWQGKTTVLLELLKEFRVDQLSCDTTVLFPRTAGAGQSVRGWPSPFSVSHGTMSDHEALAGRISPERRNIGYDRLWREGKKSVFRSAEIVTWFGSSLRPHASDVAAVVLLRFRKDEPASVRRVEDVDAVAGALQTVYLGSRDPIYHNWHCWLACPDERIDANIAAVAADLHAHVPVYEVTWGPSVVSLLRRTEPLGGWHRCAPRDDHSPGTAAGTVVRPC